MEPEWFKALPDISVLTLSFALRVDGEFCVEVFSGSGVMTLGILMHRIPAVRPWDIQHGERFNVLTHEPILALLIEAGRIVSTHMGTPCQSSTLARCPQLRSLAQPRGISNLSGHDATLLRQGNELIDVSVRLAWCLLLNNGYFSIENPFPCWIWVNPTIVQLWEHLCVVLITFSMWCYGAPYDKVSAILSN